MDKEILDWLLEDKNPAVAYRTKTEILDEKTDISAAKEWILTKFPENWQETKGLWYSYYVTALAECGVTRNDFTFSPRTEAFSYGCADFMYLRALIKMGYGSNGKTESCKSAADQWVADTLSSLSQNALPDGGFLCERRRKNFSYTPKSCYKANFYALMFLAECRKQNLPCDIQKPLIDYFLKHNIFYKSGSPSEMILNCAAETFHPFEPMQFGVHNMVETFSALGFGDDDRLKEVWNFLYQYKSESGKYLLKQTLSKSYLPKEKPGKESKWVTFYAELAEKERRTAQNSSAI